MVRLPLIIFNKGKVGGVRGIEKIIKVVFFLLGIYDPSFVSVVVVFFEDEIVALLYLPLNYLLQNLIKVYPPTYLPIFIRYLVSN